jgi:hypothetical protein
MARKMITQLVKGEKFYYTTAAASGNGDYTAVITVAAIVPLLGTELVEVWAETWGTHPARLWGTYPGTDVAELVAR